MGSVRQKVRELVGTEPEQRLVARGLVPVKVSRTTWMYVRANSKHNPSRGVQIGSEPSSDDSGELTSGEQVSGSQTASEPVAESKGLDDQEGQQSWSA